jgi:[acyl-carrier-protein] S-malonyltransferase
MSLALLFPGQGTQHAAMLPWLAHEPAAAPAVARLADVIGADWREHLQDAHWASRNDVAQPLITAVALAAWACLTPQLAQPAVVAGYSVGELPAFCAAGVFGLEVAMQLAQERAAAMDRCVAGTASGLLSVQGLVGPALDSACKRLGLVLALRLGVDKVVLGGPSGALDLALAEFDAAGLRCTRLAVQIASHTPWVAGAAVDLAHTLEAVEFRRPQALLVCNFGGAALRDPPLLKQALAGQIATTVPWDSCMDAVAERRVSCVLEVGPGNTLSRLWNERHTEIPARSIDEFRSAAAVSAWVDSALARAAASQSRR